MAKTSDLLTAMEDVDDVLSNMGIASTAGNNQNRAARSLNHTQDLMEMVIARFPRLMATVDDTTAQTVGQEYSNLPSGCKRVDALWFLDGSTGLPRYEIEAEREPSGHRASAGWPLFDVSSDATGRPEAYWWAHGSGKVYWDRQPDTTNGIRVVGFFAADDMTIVTTDSTFAYGDELMMPFAAVAAEVFKFRQGDDWQDLHKFATQYFTPVIDQYRQAWKHQKGEIRGAFPRW